MIDHNKFTAMCICLNDADKLDTALYSLNSQFTGQIIIVDGGSVDNSIEIAKKYTNTVLKVKAGINRQIKCGINFSKTEFLLIIESDHYYPDNFFDNFISEYFSSNLEVMQSKVLLKHPKTIWEFFHKLFLKLHYMDSYPRYDISAPSIWPRELLKNCLEKMTSVEGYSWDTSLSIYLRKNKIKSGIGNNVAYEKTLIDSKRFLRRFLNYGEGDYEILEKNKKKWTLMRKIESITHVGRRYWFEFPIKCLTNKINPVLIPYLYLIGLIRYYGFVKTLFKNL